MPDLEWIGNTPRSTRFDDVYFQAEDGLAESRAHEGIRPQWSEDGSRWVPSGRFRTARMPVPGEIL